MNFFFRATCLKIFRMNFFFRATCLKIFRMNFFEQYYTKNCMKKKNVCPILKKSRPIPSTQVVLIVVVSKCTLARIHQHAFTIFQPRVHIKNWHATSSSRNMIVTSSHGFINFKHFFCLRPASKKIFFGHLSNDDKRRIGLLSPALGVQEWFEKKLVLSKMCARQTNSLYCFFWPWGRLRTERDKTVAYECRQREKCKWTSTLLAASILLLVFQHLKNMENTTNDNREILNRLSISISNNYHTTLIIIEITPHPVPFFHWEYFFLLLSQVDEKI